MEDEIMEMEKVNEVVPVEEAAGVSNNGLVFAAIGAAAAGAAMFLYRKVVTPMVEKYKESKKLTLYYQEDQCKPADDELDGNT